MSDTSIVDPPATPIPPIAPAIEAVPSSPSLIGQTRALISSVPITVTVAAGMTPAAVAPVLAWGLNGFPKPVPPDVSLSIAGMLMVVAHGIKKFFEPWLERRLNLPVS